MADIRYSIVEGSLPVGVVLDDKTGKLVGPIDFSNLGIGPVWNGPAAGSLGVFNEGATITLPAMDATLSGGFKASLGILSNGQYLPWGLVFNPVTGVISGTIAELLDSQTEASAALDGPIWTTAFGKLADFDEGSVANIQLAAMPRDAKTVKVFNVVAGALPWGLLLDSATGKITGTVADLFSPGLTIEVPKLPQPVWNTPQGAIAIMSEGETATGLLIRATPDTGRQMVKYCIRSGGLPFGLTLNFTTGAITGTIAELIGQTDPLFYEADKDPQISNTVVVQATNREVANTGSLGVYSKNTAVSIQFAATPYAGRTLRNYAMVQGTLPFGLTLNQTTGLIQGTIANTTLVKPGVYSFTLRVTDTTQAFALRSYTITVQ